MTGSLNRDIATGIAAFFVTAMLILAGGAGDPERTGASADRNASPFQADIAQAQPA